MPINCSKRRCRRFAPKQNLTSLRHTCSWLVLFGWGLGLSVPLGYFHASHSIAFLAPNTPIVVQDVPGDLVWTLQHVLAEDCRCSAKIIASLLARESKSDVLEAVTLLSGSEATARPLREKGYDARIVDSDSLCGAYAIAAVPFFQVIGPDHTLWHSGSYFSGSARIGSKTAVVEALDGAMKGEHVPSRPIFGCAVSESLRSRLDPFRLKYLDKSSET